jgi:hypothetical protein
MALNPHPHPPSPTTAKIFLTFIYLIFIPFSSFVFKVYPSVRFGIFTKLYNHHHSLILEYVYYLQKR